MAKNFVFVFGQGSSNINTGLSPTFLAFKTVGGSAIAAPGITEIPTSTGLYYTTYGPTNTIAFTLDGFTSGLGSARYIYGTMDPINAIDEYLGNTFYPFGVSTLAFGASAAVLGASLIASGASLTAQGVSLNALGVTILSYVGNTSPLSALIGGLSSSFGNSASDPTTVFGYLKRLQEFNEGNSLFTKSTSIWDIYSRGSSALLAEKTLNDSSGNVTKT